MKRKRTHTILATITLISVILTSACTAGNANSTMSSAPETAVTTTTAPAVTGTVMDRIDEPKAEVTTAQTTAATKPQETKATETTAAAATTKPQETKKAETTTAQTTTVATTAKPKPATTTTAATTKPAPEWTESKASGTKYVNTDCYSRKKAVLGAETVKLYSVNDKVTVTAKTDTGYFKLSDGSFIHSDYLSDSEVAQTTTTIATTAKKVETPNEANSFYSNYSYGSKQYLCELCEYYGFTEYTEKDRNNVDNYMQSIFETYESDSYEKQLQDYISKYLGKHNGRYEIIYDDVYNVYGIRPFTYIPDSEWRFTKQDCEDILKACEKYAKDNGYGYCKPSDFDTVKGKVYQDSSWSQVYANSPAPNFFYGYTNTKEGMINILCGDIQLNYEEGLGATCVDYCLASEYCQWAKEHWGVDISNDTACQDLTAYVFFPCY